MSVAIDERVVEMRFDNKQFEENARQSMSTLEKLKSALKLDNITNGFKSINAAANNVNMDGLSNATDTVRLKFSAMEVAAITALQNITNKAVDTGLQLVKSVTVDQVAEGFRKFGDKTQSVGTLISQGFNLDEVNSQLEKLNWFTDETSYNFVDMVGNIGKFTASGQSLDDSVESMMGIANWAALSGQNAQKASMAMYQLSQAMGKGALKYDDWKSIQNASMDTVEFRQKAVEAAIAVGSLTKDVEGFYHIIKDGEELEDAFTLNDLFISEQLTGGRWLNSAAMIETFKNYAGAVDQIYEKVQDSGGELLASEAIKEMNGQLDEFQLKAFRAAQEARTWEDVVDSLADAASTSWMNIFEDIFGDYEEAKTLWTDMANSLYDVFVEPINGIEEVLSRWKDKGGRDLLLEGFGELGETLSSIISPIQEAWEAIFPEKDIRVASSQLVELTRKFGELMKSLRLSEGAQSGIQVIFKGLFSVLKVGVNVLKAFAKICGAAFKVAWKLFDVLLSAVGTVGEFVESIIEGVKGSDQFKSVMDAIEGVVSKVRDGIKGLVDRFGELGDKLQNMPGVQKLLNTFREIKSWLEEKITNAINKVLELIQKFSNSDFEMPTIDDLAGAIDFVAGKFADFINWCDTNFSWVGELISGAFSAVSEFFSNLGVDVSLPGILEAVGKAFNTIYDVLVKIKDDAGGVLGGFKDIITRFIGDPQEIMNNISTAASGISDALREFFGAFDSDKLINAGKLALALVAIYFIVDALRKIHGAIGGLTAIPKTINGVLLETKNTLVAYQDQLRAGTILKVAIAIGILTASIYALSFIDSGTLTTITAYLIGLIFVINILVKTLTNSSLKDKVSDGLGGISEALGGFFDGIGKMLGRAATIASIGLLFLSLAAAVAIIASVVKKLMEIPFDAAMNAVAIIGVILAELTISMGLLMVISTMFNKFGGTKVGAGMAVAFIGIAAAVAILAKVMKSLATMEGSVGKAIGIMSFLAVFLAVVAGASSYSNGMISFAAGMLIMSAAMAILVAVLKKATEIDVTNGWGGIIALLATLATMGVAMGAVKKSFAEIATTLVALAGMTAILAVLVKIFKQLEGLDYGQVVKGLLLLGVSLVALGTIAVVLGQFSSALIGLSLAIAIAGAGFLAGGLAIMAFGEGIKLLSTYLAPLGQAIVDFANTIKDNGTAIADAFVAVLEGAIKAVVAVAPMIGTMGSVLLLYLAAGLTNAVPGLLTTLGYVLIEVCNWLGTAADIVGTVLFRLSINVLNGLANAIWENSGALWTAIQNIINALLYLVVSGVVMIIDELLTVIDAQFGNLLPGLHAGIEKLKGGLEEAADDLKEFFKPKEIELAANEYADAISNGLSGGLPKIKEAAGSLFGAVPEAAEEQKPKLEQEKEEYKRVLASITDKDTTKKAESGTKDMVASIAGTLLSGTGSMENGASSLIEAFGDTFSGEGVATALQSSDLMNSELVKGLMDPSGMADAGTANALSYFGAVDKADGGPSGKALAKETANAAKNSKEMSEAGSANGRSYSGGVSSQTASAKRAAVALAQETVYGVKSVKDKMEEAGKHVSNGFILGIKAKLADAERAGAALGRSANTGLRNEERVKSPSKEFMKLGNFVSEGFIIGMLELKSKVEEAGGELGKGAFDSVNSTLSYVSDLIDGNLELDPTIRPVLDTSLLQNGLTSVDSMLASQRSMALAAGVSLNASNVGPTLEQQIGTAVDNALNKIYDKIEEAASKQPYQINVPLNIDKRQFARATATVTREELDRIDYFNGRKAGIA